MSDLDFIDWLGIITAFLMGLSVLFIGAGLCYALIFTMDYLDLEQICSDYYQEKNN